MPLLRVNDQLVQKVGRDAQGQPVVFRRTGPTVTTGDLRAAVAAGDVVVLSIDEAVEAGYVTRIDESLDLGDLVGDGE